MNLVQKGIYIDIGFFVVVAVVNFSLLSAMYCSIYDISDIMIQAIIYPRFDNAPQTAMTHDKLYYDLVENRCLWNKLSAIQIKFIDI